MMKPAPLCPEDFLFIASSKTIEGRAFSPLFEFLAWGIVAATTYGLIASWQQGDFGGETGIKGLKNTGWFFLAWVVLVWMAWEIRHSITRIDPQGVQQSWLWKKEVYYKDLSRFHFVRVRGLEALIAPRVYARTVTGKLLVFYVATPDLQKECARLSAALNPKR